MIRRGFWLATGAATGIVAYRRVSTAGRRLSDHLNLTAGPRTASAAQPWTVKRARRGTLRAAREPDRFTRDVREGMALHTAQRSGPNLSTNHDAQPEDGY